jgi:hypothetical protein
MSTLYELDRNKLPFIIGKEYPLDLGYDSMTFKIFAVPQKDAVGTSELGNYITLIELGGTKAQFAKIKGSYPRGIGGGGVFLPAYSKDRIAYALNRAFFMFDLRRRTSRYWVVSRILQGTIDNVAVIDPEKNLFLFQEELLLGMDREAEVLTLLDLSADEPKEVASYRIKKAPLWASLGPTTFHFSEELGKRMLHALDRWLQPIEHPLQALYNRPGTFTELGLPVIHPSFPFATVFASFGEMGSDGSHQESWIVSWRDPTKTPEVFNVFGSAEPGEFRFSPDGKWALFVDWTKKPKVFMVMPVDPALPHFLGPPILLRPSGEIPDEWNGNCAWATDPLSVVCSQEELRDGATPESNPREFRKLVKWEISQKAVQRGSGGR